MSKKPRRVDGGPPYTRYAFLNPYNLSLVIGASAAAAMTGQWWLGVCGAAGEALWLLFAPGSKVLQRAWDPILGARTVVTLLRLDGGGGENQNGSGSHARKYGHVGFVWPRQDGFVNRSGPLCATPRLASRGRAG